VNEKRITQAYLEKLEAWAKEGRRNFTIHYDDLMMRHPRIWVFDYAAVHGVFIAPDDPVENLAERIAADKRECLRREAGA
jgi:hypothetical protein